ncbi:hypothetical protein VUR80DRAFT_3281 [Thermomyces stellatus]
MAPTLRRRADPAQVKTGLIAIAVVASVAVTALIIYLVVFRQREKQYQEAAKRDPYLTRKEWARRRKLSNLERLEEEEVQRQLILRKTLTSRTSSRNDSILESRREATNSAEEPRKPTRKKSRGEEWKRWEAGFGAEVENVDCEGHPLIEQHPAIKGDKDQLSRSVSPTRTPLLSTQEPESQRTSPWERRLSDPQNNIPSPRTSSNSPPQAPPSSSTAPDSTIERPHITDHSAHHQSHNSSSCHSKSAAELQRQSRLPLRSRAASADAQLGPEPRSTASPLHSRASSNPVKLTSSQIPNPPRARSSSAFTAPSPSLVSPPPPAALLPSASPRSGEFLAQELERPRTQTQRAQSLFPVQERPIQTRTRSHEMLPYWRTSSPSPARSLRRNPVPTGAPSGKVPTSLASATRAAVVSPVLSPVEAGTLENEPASVSPAATLLPDGPPSFPEKEELERMAVSDRDILPSRLQETLHLGSPLSRPQQNNTSSGDSQASSFGGGAIFEGTQAALSNLPTQSDRGSSSPPHVPGVAAPEQQADHPDVGNDEVGTAFSFEVGDRLKELAISVRRISERPPSPATIVSEPHQQQTELDSEDDEVSSTFSAEEEDYLKELGVPIQNRSTQRPNETSEVPLPQQPAPYIDPEGQGQHPAFSFEEDSQLKEMELSRKGLLPGRRNAPLSELQVRRLTKDRSRSFEDRGVSQPGVDFTPDVAVQRLRSRSFEPIAPGKWELQVSVLDQTGTRHSRTSKEGNSDGFHSPASEPPSPDQEDVFDADVHRAPLIVPSRPKGAPVAVKGSPYAPSEKSSPSMIHNRTPSTPLTSPDSDTSGLCRANFASPIKEKQLAEERLASRSPPAYQPVYSPSPISPPMQTPSTFFPPSTQTPHTFASPPMDSASTFSPRLMQSPHGFVSPQTEVSWAVASPGWGHRETMEADYSRDTMKEMFGLGPQVTGSDNEKSKVSFRLSGPPDFMPAFF